MELIKRQIKIDPTKDQSFVIMLSASIHDLGFFDTAISGVSTVSGGTPFIVTGFSDSRLSELRKYTVSGDLSKLYKTSTGSTVDGLDLSKSFTGATATTYQYYLGGITYVDSIVSGVTAFTTTFSFQSLGLNDPNNFDTMTYIKDENKQNLVEKSQVSRDVFIDRQEQSVFERNYRLRAVNSLNNVLTYAGGNYFTVYNNT